MKILDAASVSEVLARAKASSLMTEEDTTVAFFAWDILEDRMQRAKDAFPPTAIHTVTIKANPLSAVLKDVAAFGFGLEAASFEEAWHACRFAPRLLAWDSPVKTDLEFQKARNIKGLMVSCDHLGAIEQLRELETPGEFGASLRINPQIKGSAHATMTVGDMYSKFGEPISNRENIIRGVLNCKAIRGLHVHVSSQTHNFSELIEAARTVVDLANEINQRQEGKITFIDIGGGFPVDYTGSAPYDIREYANALKRHCPELFDGQYRIVTEFGRYYHANAGFTATLVSHARMTDRGQILLAHAGADLFIRECYQPGVWPHRFLLFDKDFKLKQTAAVPTDVAGPLCFGGDYIQRNFSFHQATAGDWIAILDTGANSVSMWSKHCSRSFPKCIQYGSDFMRVIRQRDTLERNSSFWDE